MSKHHLKVLQVLLASITSLTLACQTQAPPVQSPSLKNVPNLLNPAKPALPTLLRNKIIAGKGNPEFVSLKTLAQMRQEGIPTADADGVVKQSSVLNKHFGVLQSFPVIDCETPGLSQCSFEAIGDFDEYNAAYRAAYYGAYPSDAFDTLCAYDEWRYCTEDPDSPGCFKRVHEIKFYGCTCPDVVDPNYPIPGCQAQDLVRVKYPDTPSNEFLNLNQAIEMYENNTYHYRDKLVLNAILQADHSAQLNIFDASNQVVWSQNASQTGELNFDGQDNQGNRLPLGDYRLVIEIQGEEVSSTSLKITPVKLPLALHITHPNYPIPEGEIPAFYPPADRQYLNLSVQAVEAWTLELKDPGGSTVYYSRSSGNQSIVWEGRNRSGSLVAPGRYQAVLSAGSRSVSQALEVRSFETMDGLELYHSRDIRLLLDSVESRLGPMEIEVENLVRDAQAVFPGEAPYQVQSLPDISGFRVQQQQVDPPPLNYFEEPLASDVPKSYLDAQNDRIVRDVEVMRQKVNWVKQVTQSFQTQASSESANEFMDRANKIEKKFYGISTSGGCFNYYAYKPKWKRKRGPVVDENGGSCIEAVVENQLDSAVMTDEKIVLKGRILNPKALCSSDEVDMNQIASYFFGDIEVVDYEVQSDESGAYTITITDFSFTDAYLQRYDQAWEAFLATNRDFDEFEPPTIEVQTASSDNFTTQAILPLPVSVKKSLAQTPKTLNRIPLTGDCSIKFRSGGKKGYSYHSIHAAFDIDPRNRDITLALKTNAVLGKKNGGIPSEAEFQNYQIRFLGPPKMNIPNTYKWLIDNDGDNLNEWWRDEPDKYLARFEKNIQLDQESGLIPTYKDYDGVEKDAYEEAKKRNPNLKTPFLDSLNRTLGGLNYDFLAIDSSILSDHILKHAPKSKSGELTLYMLFNDNYDINLKFVLKNGRWSKIECQQE